MIDDDIEDVRRWNYKDDKFVAESINLQEFIEKSFVLCEEWDCRLFGVNIVGDKGSYREYSPFSLNSWISGSFMGFLNNECSFDERIPLKEDLDMSVQVLNKYRRLLRFNYVHLMKKDHKNMGGCADYRTIEREKEQFDRAQRKRQKIIDDAIAAMAKFASNEEAVLAKQQAEARAKEDAKFADKARKQREMREAIEESRKMQNDMRQKQKDEDDALALEMQRRWKLRNEQLNADEKRERKERYDAAKAHQAFLLAQAEEKKRERREEREGSLRQAKIAQQVSAEEEGRFFDEVRKALQNMEPGANNHSVKKCFNLKEKLQEAW